MKLTDLPALSVLTQRIEADRHASILPIVEEFEPAARDVRRAIDADTPGTGVSDVVDRNAREMLAAYRALPARSLGAFDAVTRATDRLFRSERHEILDSSQVPPFIKHAAMLGLEWVNRRVGSYDLWLRALAPLVDDLASPHSTSSRQEQAASPDGSRHERGLTASRVRTSRRATWSSGPVLQSASISR